MQPSIIYKQVTPSSKKRLHSVRSIKKKTKNTLTNTLHFLPALHFGRENGKCKQKRHWTTWRSRCA
jgi:hypothetical protein